jgi:hydrogenase maturation protease
MRNSRLLIIGYGNPLRQDDGLGWHAATRLSETLQGNGVQVLACHQLTPELAETISQAERVVFIDVNCTQPPGQISCRTVTPDSNPRPPALDHVMNPSALLGSALALYKASPEAVMLSVGGQAFDFGPELSRAVSEAIPRVLAMISEMAGAKLHHA